MPEIGDAAWTVFSPLRRRYRLAALGAGILVRQITGVESGHTRLPCADVFLVQMFLKVNWTGWLSETLRAAIEDYCSTLRLLHDDEFFSIAARPLVA